MCHKCTLAWTIEWAKFDVSIFLFFQEVINGNDPKLLSLKNDLGEEAYVAVVTALKELHEYQNSDDA